MGSSYDGEFVLPPRPGSSRSVGFSSEPSRSASSVSSSAADDRFEGHAPAVLLKRRVLRLDHYAMELERGGDAALSKADRIRKYGSSVVPVPVPLDLDESFTQYEKAFDEWLSTQGTSRAILRANANQERSRRMAFARTRAEAYSARRGRSQRGGAKRGRIVAEEQADEDDDGCGADSAAKRVRRDTTGGDPRQLLRTRVMTVRKYREAGGNVEHTSGRMPIPVPLFPGETEDEYERKFLAFVSTGTLDLARLADEPNTERSMRIQFARNRLRGPISASANRVVEATAAPTPAEVGEKPSILFRVAGLGRHEAAANEFQPERAKQAPQIVPEDSLGYPPRCIFVLLPTANSSPTDLSKAYLDCGCRACMVQCTAGLVAQVTALEKAVQTGAASAHAASNPARDLAKDTDVITTNGIFRGVDVARMLEITSLMKSRRPRQISPGSADAATFATDDDPIERQLLDQYELINEQVVANECALDAPSSSLNADAVLRAAIDRGLDRRDAALATLIVYMWRHAKQDLEQRLAGASSSTLAQIQRACHHKCAAFASELSQQRSRAASLKQQLDDVLGESVAVGGADAGDAEAARLGSLQAIGEELTRVETAMAAMRDARRREFATLLHFDSYLRELVCTLLRET